MSLVLDIVGFFVLVIVALIIVYFIRLVLILIPAAVVALVVWYLTGSGWLAGIGFLVISALSILKKA